MKNPKDPIRNRACDVPTCSTVPQLTAVPHTPQYTVLMYNHCYTVIILCIGNNWRSDRCNHSWDHTLWKYHRFCIHFLSYAVLWQEPIHKMIKLDMQSFLFVCVCDKHVCMYVCRSCAELCVFKSVLRTHFIPQDKIHITAEQQLYLPRLPAVF